LIDDQPAVVAERSERPGIGRRPLGGVDGIFVIIENLKISELLKTKESLQFQKTFKVSKKGEGTFLK
jgi:hypothetical protein